MYLSVSKYGIKTLPYTLYEVLSKSWMVLGLFLLEKKNETLDETISYGTEIQDS